MDPDTGAIPLYRACTACRRLTVPVEEAKKTCRKCRTKSSERARRKREEAYAGTTLHAHNSEGPSPQNMEPSDQSLNRKPEKALRELEGEEQRRAIKMMKDSINIAAQRSHTLPQERNDTAHTEYQKASSLYDAIRFASSSSRSYNFSGCHSIIKSDSIGHYNRARMVVKDLRKIVKIPFKYDIPLQAQNSNTRSTLKYSCTCRKSASIGPGNENINATDTACGGTVAVTVRNDDSHPVGIPGQQIIVEIIHPSA